MKLLKAMLILACVTGMALGVLLIVYTTALIKEIPALTRYLPGFLISYMLGIGAFYLLSLFLSTLIFDKTSKKEVSE